MNIFNILATQITVFDTNLNNVPLTGITKIVSDVINFFSFGGYIAVGILLFSLILKILPLPFDIYSRVAMKKNALKMEKMRPELEKLQKQYANNKELYSQKMMALYKKEGYSTFASCLPTIFTLVFFIIVISAFTQYSTYCKIDIYNKMAVSYSQDIRENENVEIRLYNVDDKNDIIEDSYSVITLEEYNAIEENQKYRVLYFTNLSEEEIKSTIIAPAQDKAADIYFANEKANSFLWVKNIWIEDLPWKKAFLSKDVYLNSTFAYSQGCSCKAEQINSSIKNEEAYDVLFGSPKLDSVKNQPNGLLILVLLSIASMLVSQLIMSKSQKAQMELQSVDGTAAQTNKMMTWMMPIMFGIFSFMYTASFSLYLIVSTVFSTLSTVFINKIVETKFKKDIKKQEEERYNKRFGYLNKKK